MRLSVSIMLCLLLPPVAAPALAAYQVEVVVFAHAAADADGEQWVGDAGLPDPSGFAMLGSAPDPGIAVLAPLPAASQRLGGVVGALRRSGRYRTLFHSSWLQPEGGRIRGAFISQSAAGAMPEAAAELVGSVRVRVTRFLHADVDMAFLAPAPADGGHAVHVRLQESRKIRLNEVHYFDHPLFGVMLQVSRVGPDSDAGTEAVEAEPGEEDIAAPGLPRP